MTEVVSFDSNGDQSDPPVFVSQIRNGTPVQIAVTTCPPADASPVGGGECRRAAGR